MRAVDGKQRIYLEWPIIEYFGIDYNKINTYRINYTQPINVEWSFGASFLVVVTIGVARYF